MTRPSRKGRPRQPLPGPEPAGSPEVGWGRKKGRQEKQQQQQKPGE